MKAPILIVLCALAVALWIYCRDVDGEPALVMRDENGDWFYSTPTLKVGYFATAEDAARAARLAGYNPIMEASDDER